MSASSNKARLKVPFAVWGAIPSLAAVNAHHVIDMPLDVRTFLLGLGIGLIVTQFVSLYHNWTSP